MKNEYETYEDFERDLFPKWHTEKEERMEKSREKDFLNLFFL